RDLGGLVVVERTAVGALEVTLVLAIGAGERAFFVAEELRFDQLRRDRAAVKRQERRALPSAHLMNGLRGELLAGAGLAHQQNGCRRRRDATELVIELLH